MIPIRPSDDDWVLVFSDALAAIAVADDDSEVRFEELHFRAREHTKTLRTPTVPVGPYRRLLTRTGFPVFGQNGAQVVKGLRLIDTQEATE